MTRPRILVVDDEPEMRAMLDSVLRRAGFDVEQAADGQAGLDEARARPPDLVITDILMPRLDGWQLCRRLRAEGATARVPIIFLSLRSRAPDRIYGLQLGADDFLAKPFDTRELVARVRAVLKRAAVAAATEGEDAGITGNLRDMSLVDIAQVLDLGRKTAAVRVTTRTAAQLSEGSDSAAPHGEGSDSAAPRSGAQHRDGSDGTTRTAAPHGEGSDSAAPHGEGSDSAAPHGEGSDGTTRTAAQVSEGTDTAAPHGEGGDIPAEDSVLYFDNGALVHAARGPLEGMPALTRLLVLGEGRFEIVLGGTPPRRTLTGSTQELLLEALRKADEQRARAPARSAARHGEGRSAPAPAAATAEARGRAGGPAPEAARRPAPAAPVRAARSLEPTLLDLFALGVIEPKG